jgi:CHAT domain-containing protein
MPRRNPLLLAPRPLTPRPLTPRPPAVRLLAFIILAGTTSLAGCVRPPAASYVPGVATDKPPPQISLGQNSVGEACTMQDVTNGGAEVYCGTWQQPSARLHPGDAASADSLAGLARNSAWRQNIDAAYACQPPIASTILNGQPAELLQCTQRAGGWPHIAMVALVGGRAWYADGVLPAATAMERGIGVRAGVVSADAAPQSSAADALFAQRLAAQSVTSGDIGQYQSLLAAGVRANLSDNTAAAEAAFRAALAVQRKALGANNPNSADATMALALQLSDEGRFQDAAGLFTEAEALAPRAANPLSVPRLLHYRGLDAVNRDDNANALILLRQADAAYAALIPPQMMSRPTVSAAPQRVGVLTNQNLLTDPEAEPALVGLIEVRRMEGAVLRGLGQLQASDDMLGSASALAQTNGLARPILQARLDRTRGVTALALEQPGSADTDLQASISAFERSLPGSKPMAETALLAAAQAQLNKEPGRATTLCRDAIRVLTTLATSTTPELMAPCLDTLGNAGMASNDPATRKALLADMFSGMQLAQSNITAQQIAQAAARLQENARDPRVAEAIRHRQDLGDQLQTLQQQRDAAAAGNNSAATAALDDKLKKAQADYAAAEAALQAASPNFGQLAQQVVSADAVFAALRPEEAVAVITLGPKDGWTVVLHNNQLSATKINASVADVTTLVKTLRAGIEPTEHLPTFDPVPAEKIYQLTLAQQAAALDGVRTLVVAPSGPLLAIPFEVLLTGPTDANDLAKAPWLLRRFTIEHVPAAANFVSLRKASGGSRAAQPWFGFGDFIPVTLAQAQRSFPGASCAESAQDLAGLPILPAAKTELAAARTLLGASPNAELLGAAFTKPAVLKTPLKDYRILHFATHAILPSELTCQSEPAIITSDPAGAQNADQALLTSSDVTQLDLDADLVILSACNSGGGNGGGTGGESLSGLARAFFFAGARALLVTHWSVNDKMAAYLVTQTLAKMRDNPGEGAAGALREAQLAVLNQAGNGLPAVIAHPFFWAPFALIGAGGASGAPPTQATLPSGRT